MNAEELKDYIRSNLTLEIKTVDASEYHYGEWVKHSKVVARLLLEGEIISEDEVELDV